MNIIVNTTNVSREEVQELKDYLEENCWNWKTNKVKNEPIYDLRENGIYVIGSHMVKLHKDIQQKELHKYSIINRKEFIDELIRWIAEAKEGQKELMKEDMFMLNKWKDDYILTSNSTNSYVRQKDSEFNAICEELIEINKKL
jgi:hypothetical protein